MRRNWMRRSWMGWIELKNMLRLEVRTSSTGVAVCISAVHSQCCALIKYVLAGKLVMRCEKLELQFNMSTLPAVLLPEEEVAADVAADALLIRAPSGI